MKYANQINTPLDQAPQNLFLLKTFERWSPGTKVDFIEYTDTRKGFPTAILGRIKDEQLVIPLEYLVERRNA